MKKLLVGSLILVMAFCIVGCGGEKASGFQIPDVFGIDYNSAIEILEAEGYEVKAVETSVASISEKLLYPLETVDKGTVFKIDDYILDNNGYLNKNYDIDYEGELVSEDKNIVIYYAKEDYTASVEEKVSTSTTNNAIPSSAKQTTTTTGKKTTTTNDSGLDADFKAAMDSYEKFMNEYVAFMKKYKANPSDLSLLADYADYMSKYADFVEDFENWEDEDMNAAETAYYIDVQSRVSKKLLEVAQ